MLGTTAIDLLPSKGAISTVIACSPTVNADVLNVAPRAVEDARRKTRDGNTFEEPSRLVEAMNEDPERLALVLLGAEAGLRQGETMRLKRGDVASKHTRRAVDEDL